jgi:hypothetical protein
MLRAIYYVLWIAPVVIFTVLTVIMVKKNQRKRFPFFFAYCVFQVPAFVIQFTTYHMSQISYFYAWWTLSVLSIGISFAVIYEIFTEVFRPFDGLRDLGAALFRWAAAVLVIAAVMMSISGPSAPGPVALRAIVSLERSVRVMQCGLVLLMIVCSPYLGLRYRHRVFGIGAGFGILAALDLIAVAVLGRLGFAAQDFFTLGRMAAFNFAALMWGVYFLRPEPARQPALQLAPSERWDFALSAAMHPQSASPSLPLIMGVVDRAFERASHDSRGSGPRKADQ